MGIVDSRKRLAKRVIWLAAGAGVWLFVVNRVIMHWPHEIAKTATMGLLGIGIVALTWILGGRVERAIWTRAASLVLIGFSVGEIHRFWLRSTYQRGATGNDAAPSVSLLHPWTTTSLTRRHHEIAVDPQIGRLRVVHLTDLHLTHALPWEFYRSIVERTNAEEPDLVLLTGDLLTKKKFLPLLERWLSLPFHARLGVYAVLGNHEFWAGAADEVRQLLATANVKVLSGACARLTHPRFEHVVVCGTEQPWGPDFALPRATTEDLVLALSHTPDNIYSLRGRAQAVFGGHLHGGQWRIPGVGALIVPSAYGRRFDQGHFVVDGTHLFVSAGLGADAPPLRVYCPPELLVVDFVGRESANEAIAHGVHSTETHGLVN